MLRVPVLAAVLCSARHVLTWPEMCYSCWEKGIGIMRKRPDAESACGAGRIAWVWNKGFVAVAWIWDGKKVWVWDGERGGGMAWVAGVDS